MFILIVSAKSKSTWYTDEMVSNARKNADRYSWARKIRSDAVIKAGPWIAMSDEELWSLVPPATLPRPSGVKWGGACPHDGAELTKWGYRYKYNIKNEPWKVRCPSCNKIFPSNDFGAYYNSGIDDDGQFHRELADESLLYNLEHPDPNDPRHKEYVDDGRGWVNEKGERFNFIGYYIWGVWTEIFEGLEALGDAYVYTNDPIYAHKAAILLDRIADLYPEMDITETVTLGQANDGFSGRGKLFGRIAETFNIRYLTKAYDIIYGAVAEDDELHAFLKSKAEEFDLPTKKGSPELFYANVEERILKEGAEAIINGDIGGNLGMHQYSMGAIAIVYDKEPYTSQWLDWIFRSDGGKTDSVIMEKVDRNGYGAESGIGYARGWLRDFMGLADLIRNYDPDSEYNLYTRYGPKFERWYHTEFDLLNGRQGTPSIGDHGSCGRPGNHVNVDQMVEAFELFRNPRFAQIAYWGAQGEVDEIHSNIFHPEPYAIRDEILKVAQEHEPFQLSSVNLGGYGYTSLRSGDHYEDTLRTLSIYYGRSNVSHGHKDRLNLGLTAFNMDLMPDLGYPERTGAWPKALAWTANTISHNTVVVDECPQFGNWGGKSIYMMDLPGAKVAEVDGNNVYPTSVYIRTSSCIDISEYDFYVVDIFRVRGGNDHLYSFHGPESRLMEVDGLKLTPQTGGTYYSPDTDFAENVFGDYGARSPGQGFQYLHSVQRGEMTGDSFSIEYRVVDTWMADPIPRNRIRLRITGLGQYDKVDLAVGEPPHVGNNPEFLPYVLIRKSNENVEKKQHGLLPALKRGLNSIFKRDERVKGPLETRFVTVIEAYEGKRVVEKIERLKPIKDDAGAMAVAVKVKVPGRTDYIISSLDPTVEVRFEDDIAFKGRYGVISFDGDEFLGAKLVSTSYLKIGGISYKNPKSEYKGKIVDFDKGMVMESKLYVDVPLPTDGSLIGLQIHIKNRGERDASYPIESVEGVGDGTCISVGRNTFVKSYNEKDKSLIYNFKEGDEFYIPLPQDVKAEEI